MVVKQIRRLPQADASPSITPFLVNQPIELRTFQGEAGNALANHRLNMRLRLETESLWLTEENLSQSFLADARLEYTDECGVHIMTASGFGTMALPPTRPYGAMPGSLKAGNLIKLFV